MILNKYIPTNGYSPDSDPRDPSFFNICKNIVPTLRGYRSAFSFLQSSLANLSSFPLGAKTLLLNDGNKRTFVGTSTAMFEIIAGAIVDVSRAVGGAYGATVIFPWCFAQYGNVSFAVNKVSKLQFSVAAGAFADVAAAPRAAFVTVVDNFVIVADYHDGTNDVHDGWFCSAIGNYTSWTPSIATQCANGRLLSVPGPITALKRFGKQIFISKQNGIFLGEYVGASRFVWSFRAVPGDVGAIHNEVVVDVGSSANPVLLFLGKTGFYIFEGGLPKPIGINSVNSVVQTLDFSRSSEFKSYHDSSNFSVKFGLMSKNAGVYPDIWLVYNYKVDKWGNFDPGDGLSYLFDFSKGGMTWSEFAALYSTWISINPQSLPWGASLFLPSEYVPMGIVFEDSVYKFKLLTGTSAQFLVSFNFFGDWFEYSSVNRVKLNSFNESNMFGVSLKYTCLDAMETTSALIDIGTFQRNQYNTFDFFNTARWHKFEVSGSGFFEFTGHTLNVG